MCFQILKSSQQEKWGIQKYRYPDEADPGRHVQSQGLRRLQQYGGCFCKLVPKFPKVQVDANHVSRRADQRLLFIRCAPWNTGTIQMNIVQNQQQT
jgi:hypothetical protein